MPPSKHAVLSASGFRSVYSAVTGSQDSGFYIRFLEVPASGSLYSDSGATRLTDASINDKVFSYSAIGTLRYTAGTAQEESVRYAVYSSAGEPLYVGTLTFSVRVGENALWVTPTGVCKGDMTEDMLVKMTLDGTVLEGTRKPSSETKMHLRIYQENPTVRAVVHAHPPVATTFAAAGIPLDKPVLQEAVVQLGTVPVAPFALPGSQGVADSVAPFCRDYRALLLEYHGAVTWGTSMEQAHYRLECLEQVATVTLHLHTLGCHRVIPPEVVAELEGLRPAWGIL